MKWIGALLLVACTQTSPCEVKGGRCTRVDFDCAVNQVFVGYDPTCEPNVKCCVPLAGAGVPDGGPDGKSCAAIGGRCQTQDLQCETGRDRTWDESCGAGNQCCAMRCATRGGKCIPGQTGDCGVGVQRVESICAVKTDHCCLP